VLWLPTAGPVEELPPPEAAAIFAKPAWSLLSPAVSPTLGEHLAGHRDRANRLALRRLAAEVRTGHRAPEQAPEHLLAVSRAWRQVCDAAGLRG
jgi:hypothetical protein